MTNICLIILKELIMYIEFSILLINTILKQNISYTENLLKVARFLFHS
jgi:hypothetical protein